MNLDPVVIGWYAANLDSQRVLEFRGARISRMNGDELRALCCWLVVQLEESQRLLGEAVRGD